MDKKFNEGAWAEPGTSVKNKTGSWRTFKPIVTDRCVGCGTCTKFCPEGAIKIVEKNGKKKAEINYDYCKGCLICLKECPFKAIEKEVEK
ncbi:MAG: 4Fe-4S binding protein [Candidatus Aenigmarchaeota archaeon]|nr:4Fe-4S binding protein [Candidatus Aenigmarchaeota archaeon]